MTPQEQLDEATHLNERLADELRQCQQLLFTIIYSRPGHQVHLQERDFVSLPPYPVADQETHPTGGFTITVKASPPTAR